MIDAHKENNAIVGGSSAEIGVVEPWLDSVKANGSATDMAASSSRFGGDWITYKRRRKPKVMEAGMVGGNSETWPVEKSIKKSFDQYSKERCCAATVDSNDCSLKHQRNIVLEEICQSLEFVGGLKKCIQDALAFHPGSDSRTAIKESIQSCEDGSNCSFQLGPACDGLQNAFEGSFGMSSSRSFGESHHETATDLWRCTFSDTFMSEKFAELCSLLLEYGIKPDKLFDLSHINSRMKQRAYESSPLLLHSDIQQVWKKLQKLGDDIIALAKCLSDKTMTSFCEQVGSSAQSISEDARHESLGRLRHCNEIVGTSTN